jgi:tellurite methyltransferase
MASAVRAVALRLAQKAGASAGLKDGGLSHGAGEMANRSVEFFDTQFQRQITTKDFSLNPFEKLALPYLRGQVLDLGCGLGNLSITAARLGCSVTALDASVHGIEHILAVAAAEGLSIHARAVDLATFRIAGEFDVIVAIGLLMFFDRAPAYRILKDIRAHVRPGGYAIVNTLIEGTSYLDMFESGHYYLFGPDEIQNSFSDWEICESQHSAFDAPGGTRKLFSTVAARRRDNDGGQ